MGEPGGQRKCSENSFELETEPMTRKREGLWGSVMRPSWVLSGVRTEHQTFVRATRKKLGSLWGPEEAGLALFMTAPHLVFRDPRESGRSARWVRKRQWAPVSPIPASSTAVVSK